MRKAWLFLFALLLVACSKSTAELPVEPVPTGTSPTHAAFDDRALVVGSTIPEDNPLTLTITIGHDLPAGSQIGVSIPTAVQEEVDTLWSIPTVETGQPGSIRFGCEPADTFELTEAARVAGGAGRVVVHVRRLAHSGDVMRIGFTGKVPQIVPTEPFRIVELDGSTGVLSLVPRDNVAVAPVVAGPAEYLRLSLASDVRVGEQVSLHAAALDAFGNVAKAFRGAVTFGGAAAAFQGLPDAYAFTDADAGVHVFPDIRLTTEGVFEIDAKCDLPAGSASASSNPVHAWSAQPRYRRYFGDAHFHSGSDVDTVATPGGDHRGQFTDSSSAFNYLRDVAALDWGVSAEHDTGLSQETWLANQQHVDALNKPGTFVTLLGYEWTPNRRIGHQVVIFGDGPSASNILVNAATGKRGSGAATANDLATAIRQRKGYLPRVLLVPHVMQPFPNGDTDKADHEQPHEIWDGPAGTPAGGNVIYDMRRVGEIYSHHNDDYTEVDYRQTTEGRGDSVHQPQLFELGVKNPWSFQHAWATGHRIGVIAGSDNHLGTPGMNNYGPLVPQHSGLAVVLASALTRDAIFEALQARRCYATTGTKILLDFTVNAMPMGTEMTLPYETKLNLHVDVSGTAPLDSVEVLKFLNGDFVSAKTLSLGGSSSNAVLSFAEVGDVPTIYYVRVKQTDGEMAWSSPIWVDLKYE